MSTINATSGDTDIMSHTVRGDDGRLQVSLADGTIFSSSGPAPAQLRISEIEQWCSAVRKFCRQADEAKTVKKPSVAPAPEPVSSDDPDEYIRVNHREALRRLTNAELELEEAKSLYLKWDKLREAIGLEEEDAQIRSDSDTGSDRRSGDE